MKRPTRRWGRILFNTLTAISLLLAIATAGLWVRSVTLQLKHTALLPAKMALTLEVSRGTLSVVMHQSTDRWLSWPYLERDDFRNRVWPSGIGFEYWYRPAVTSRDTLGLIHGSTGVQFPLWLPLLLAAVWLSYARTSYLRPADLISVGQCPACGYDTRANPETCSECGHDIAAKRSASCSF